MTLWVLCEHGEVKPHAVPGPCPDAVPGSEYTCDVVHWVSCPGGRPATVEDLYEALGGEKVWWCEAHKSSALWKSEDRCHARHGIGCRMVERILTPTLEPEPYSAEWMSRESIRQHKASLTPALDQEKET